MQKPGRNDPCPCGSGKKFKKCCGAKMLGKQFVVHKLEENQTPSKTAALAKAFSFHKHRSDSHLPPKEDSEKS